MFAHVLGQLGHVELFFVIYACIGLAVLGAGGIGVLVNVKFNHDNLELKN